MAAADDPMITHRREDFPDPDWTQPNATFTHRTAWGEHCYLCALEQRMPLALAGHRLGQALRQCAADAEEWAAGVRAFVAAWKRAFDAD